MHKVAFDLGGWPIYWYGVMIMLGFLVGLWTASRRGLLENVPAEVIADLGPWLIGGAIVGSRLWYVVSYWREGFAPKPLIEIFMIRHGGVVFYGGLVGAILTVLIYARVKNLWVWKLADILAPSIALGHVFGRLGCLLNGCCYGRPTNLPWAICFPPDHETHGVPVHPTQLYESFLNAGLYAGLAWLYRHKRFDGQVFAVYLIGYALLRSFVECFRGDYEVRYLGGFATPAQLVSVGVLAAGIGLWHWLPRTIKSLRIGAATSHSNGV